MRLAILLVPALAFCAIQSSRADTHHNGFTKLGVDGLPITHDHDNTWAEAEQANANYIDGCDTLSQYFKTKIKCTYNKKSFENFYKAELKRPKVADRVDTTPDWLCGVEGIEGITGKSNLGHAAFSQCWKDEECAKEFASKVHSVSCEVVAKDAEPRIALERGVLKLIMTRRPNGDVDFLPVPSLEKQLQAMFPTYKKVYESNH